MLYNGASIVNAGALAWLSNAGAFDEATSVRVGPGALVLQMMAGQGFDTLRGGYLATPRGQLAASGMQAVAFSGTDEAKTVNCNEEDALGAASVFADMDFDVVTMAAIRSGRIHLVGMGHFRGTVPDWLWADGCIDPTAVVDNGPGDWTIAFRAGYGMDASECLIIAKHVDDDSQRLYSVAVDHTSDVLKRITMLREGAAGAASVMTDGRVVVAVFKIGSRSAKPPGRILAAGKIIGGVAPTFAWSWGAIDESTLARANAGEYSVGWVAGREPAGNTTGNDNDAIVLAQARGPAAVSQLRSVDHDYSVGNPLQFWLSQEGVGGAASGYVDGDIDFLILSRT